MAGESSNSRNRKIDLSSQRINMLNALSSDSDNEDTYNAIFGMPQSNARSTTIALDSLISYRDTEAGHERQPFLVRDDDEMAALVEDIRQNGIFTPLIINQRGDELMILSGHRRAYAARIVGLSSVPCIVKEYDDVIAANIVIQSNLLNREKILPSERAAAYKLKIDVLRAHRQYNKELQPHNEAVNKGVKTAELVAKEEGVSRAQIERYLQLTNLNPELLEMVDKDIIPVTAAFNMTSLNGREQKVIYDVLTETGNKLTVSNSDKIKGLEKRSKQNIKDIISPKVQKKNITTKDANKTKGNSRRIVAIPFDELENFFNNDLTDKEIIEEIIKALSLRWTND